MRLRIFSDLHLEHDPTWKYVYQGEDVILVAGDLGSCTVRGLTERFLAALPVPTYFVLGNHDLYGGEVGEVISYYKSLERRLAHFHFLHNQSVPLGRYVLAGTSLWTDFALYGADAVATSMAVAQQAINDFRQAVRIRQASKPSRTTWLHPQDLVTWHREARDFLKATMAKRRPVIVMTHWCPSAESIDPVYLGHPLNPYFTTECSDLMGDLVAFWIHGHAHSADERMIKGTRVLRNPKGYPHESSHWDPKFIVEI